MMKTTEQVSIDPVQFGELMADVRWLKGTTTSILERLNKNDANCEERCESCSQSFNDRISLLESTATTNVTRIKLLMAGAWAGGSGLIVMLVMAIGYFLKRHFEHGSI